MIALYSGHSALIFAFLQLFLWHFFSLFPPKKIKSGPHSALVFLHIRIFYRYQQYLCDTCAARSVQLRTSAADIFFDISVDMGTLTSDLFEM